MNPGNIKYMPPRLNTFKLIYRKKYHRLIFVYLLYISIFFYLTLPWVESETRSRDSPPRFVRFGLAFLTTTERLI